MSFKLTYTVMKHFAFF